MAFQQVMTRRAFLALAGITAATTFLPPVALAATGSLEKRGNMYFTDSETVLSPHVVTPYYYLNNNIAYKLDYTQADPSTQTCTIERVYTKIDSWSFTSDSMKRAILWFGFGGPGFDRSMWPSKTYDDRAMTDADYACATAGLVAEYINGSQLKVLIKGVEKNYENWIKSYVVDGDVFEAIRSRIREVPENFYVIAGRTSAGSDVISFSYAPIYCGVSVTVGDMDSNVGRNEGNGVFTGITYDIYNASDYWYVLVDDTRYAPGELVCSIDTIHDVSRDVYRAWLDPSEEAHVLPYGTYRIERRDEVILGYLDKENRTSQSSWTKVFCIGEDGQYTLSSGGNKSADAFVSQKGDIVAFDSRSAGWDEVAVIRGGVKIQLQDAQGDVVEGNSTLAGAKFEIKNVSRNEVYVPNTSGAMVKYMPGEIVAVLITDENGFVTTGAYDLPFGMYDITQITASGGYELGEQTPKRINIKEDGVIVELVGNDSFYNEVGRGGLKFTKVDRDTMEPCGEGDSTVEGAIFYIYNISKNPVTIDGKTYPTYRVNNNLGYAIDENSEPCYVIETDINGSFMRDNFLPIGSYLIREIKPPTGYLIDEIFAIGVKFEVKYTGQIIDFSSVDAKDKNFTSDTETAWFAEDNINEYQTQSFQWDSRWCLENKPND